MSADAFARPEVVAQHYETRLTLETDCADVHQAMRDGRRDFVLVDTRSAEQYADRHIPDAVSIPHASITAERLAEFGPNARFITYCWGPHCNAACKGAAAIARLGYPAKEMLGGVWGWEMEGYEFA